MSKLKALFEFDNPGFEPRYHMLRPEYWLLTRCTPTRFLQLETFRGYSTEYPKRIGGALAELRLRGLDVLDLGRYAEWIGKTLPNDIWKSKWDQEEIDAVAKIAEYRNELLPPAMFCKCIGGRLGQVVASYRLCCRNHAVAYGPEIQLERFDYIVEQEPDYNKVTFFTRGALSPLLEEVYHH